MIYDVPELPVTPPTYMPGAFAETDSYDVDGGSQSVHPEDERETGLTAPEHDPMYIGGQFVESDPYDVPEGSQGYQPEPGLPVVPEAPDDGIQMYQDPDDPQYAIVVGTGPMAGVQGIVGLPIEKFDTEDDDFVIVPQ